MQHCHDPCLEMSSHALWHCMFVHFSHPMHVGCGLQFVLPAYLPNWWVPGSTRLLASEVARLQMLSRVNLHVGRSAVIAPGVIPAPPATWDFTVGVMCDGHIVGTRTPFNEPLHVWWSLAQLNSEARGALFAEHSRLAFCPQPSTQRWFKRSWFDSLTQRSVEFAAHMDGQVSDSASAVLLP